MLKIYFTVDVEIGVDGWDDIDNNFNDSFQRYIYGRTRKGNFGLPYTLNVLNDYGLTGVFFVEALFALHFGSEPLSEITGLIMEKKQPVELHIHTEWLDEAKTPPFPHIKDKRPYLSCFARNEQKVLIGMGKNLLNKANVQHINAFRAGSFGFNIDTLSALKQNEIFVDSSYNASQLGGESGLMPTGKILTEPTCYNDIYEAPITVFFDHPGHLRHTQLCACSTRELEGVLWKALEEGRQEIVILSHSFELLDKTRTRPNLVVIKRFHKLCEFLSKNSDCFSVNEFSDFSCNNSLEQPEPLVSQPWKTGLRILEQSWSSFI